MNLLSLYLQKFKKRFLYPSFSGKNILKFILQIPFWAIIVLLCLGGLGVIYDWIELLADFSKWKPDLSCPYKSAMPSLPYLSFAFLYIFFAFQLKKKSLLKATLFLYIGPCISLVRAICEILL